MSVQPNSGRTGKNVLLNIALVILVPTALIYLISLIWK
jgi:hypothetical protein